MDLEGWCWNVGCCLVGPTGWAGPAGHQPFQVHEPSMLLPSLPPDGTLLVNLAISVVGPSLV